MVVNLKNEIESYQYGMYHLLKMIFPYDTIVTNQDTADIEVSFRVDQDSVSVQFGKCCHTEPIIRDDVMLTLKRALYQVTKAKLPFGVLTGVRPSQTALKFETDMIQNLGDVYFVSSKKAAVMQQCAAKVRKVSSRLSPGQISLYIHIPFCPSRCHYCSFTLEYLKPYPLLLDEYLCGLIQELTSVLKTIQSCQLHLYSIYIGGGTPTVLSPVQLQALLTPLASFIPTVTEFSVEAGRADTITPDKLKLLKEFGVSRISINPQSLHQKTLDAIGRCHTVEDFYRAYQWSREAGFPTVNTDLIAGLTGEDFSDFKQSLDGILALSPEHITVHTLCKKRTSDLTESVDEGTARKVNDMLDYAYQSLQPLYEPYYIYRQKNAVSSLENVGFMRNSIACEYNIFMMEEISYVVAVGAGGVSKLINFSDKKPFAKFRGDKQPERYLRDLAKHTEEKCDFLRSHFQYL